MNNLDTNSFSEGTTPPTSVSKAIILAAGSGRRLSPFTDHTPKCLAPANGVPITINTLYPLMVLVFWLYQCHTCRGKPCAIV